MTQADILKTQLAELRALATLQRGLRMGVRGLWLFGAGVLLAWGANALWGWFPDQIAWLLAGLLLGLPPLVGFIISLKRRAGWFWMADRRLGLQEQVSTAWEVSARGDAAGLSEALIADALAILPALRARLLRRGWALERDLLAALIVLLMGAMAFASTWIEAFNNQLNQAPLASAPEIDAVEPFPEPLATPTTEPGSPPQGEAQALPGEDQAGSPQAGGEGSPSTSPSGEGSMPPDLSGADPGALSEALEGLGQDLSQQAPTYDLGQELQGGDLDGAAGELDALNDQLGELSPETREQLAQAFEEAAGEVEAAGDPQLSEDLQGAADALQGENSNEDPVTGGDALDQLAQDLRERAGQLDAQANGAGAGSGSSGQTGSPEPNTRLQGEGSNFELPLDEEAAQSSLLGPAQPGSEASGTASGALDTPSTSGNEAGRSPLVPNSFLWKWRDVVSSYFQR